MNNRYSNSLILMGIIVFTFLSGSAYTEDISNEKEIQKHVQGKVELELIPLNRSVKIVKNNKFNIPRIFLAGDGRKICEFWGGRLLSRADIYFYFKKDRKSVV